MKYNFSPFKRSKEAGVAVAQPEVVEVYTMLSPEQVDKIRGKSQIDHRSWYKAIYYVTHLPDGEKVNINQVVRLANCSWPTARDMVKRIVENLHG